MTRQRAPQATLAGGRISAGRISPLPGPLFLVRRDLLHRAGVEMGMFHAIPVVLIALAGRAGRSAARQLSPQIL